MHRSASDVTEKHPRKTGETPGQQPGTKRHRSIRTTNRDINETQTRQGWHNILPSGTGKWYPRSAENRFHISCGWRLLPHTEPVGPCRLARGAPTPSVQRCPSTWWLCPPTHGPWTTRTPSWHRANWRGKVLQNWPLGTCWPLGQSTRNRLGLRVFLTPTRKGEETPWKRKLTSWVLAPLGPELFWNFTWICETSPVSKLLCSQRTGNTDSPVRNRRRTWRPGIGLIFKGGLKGTEWDTFGKQHTSTRDHRERKRSPCHVRK